MTAGRGKRGRAFVWTHDLEPSNGRNMHERKKKDLENPVSRRQINKKVKGGKKGQRLDASQSIIVPPSGIQQHDG